MEAGMYERLLITLMMMLFFGAVFLLMKRRQITLANRASRQSNKKTSKATIVYFGSNGCAACKRAQRPILEKILAEYGNEQLVLTAYDVDESPDLAKKWGVMTLPTTFLLDSTGTIKHVNNGLIVLENLRKQLAPLISPRMQSK
jgi:thiol-disulfide isomerase/thioredoxin